MKELRVCFPVDDVEMKEAVKQEFGDNVTYIEERSATGMEILYIAVIPAAALTVQIIDFILTHFVKDEDQEEPEKKGRRIEIYKSRIVLYEYSEEEVIKILKELFKD